MRLFLKLALAVAVAGLTLPARAADMAVKPVYTAPKPVGYDWTGFFAGAFVGYNQSNVDAVGVPVKLDPKGWMGGAQIGANYQFGNHLVIGVVADVGVGDVHDSVSPIAGVSIPTKGDLKGTVRARLGYAFDTAWPMLVYGTGGLAWQRNDIDLKAFGSSFKAQQTVVGPVVGGGIEVAFLPNWSLGLEYLYYGYGQDSYSFGSLISVPAKTTSNEVRLALNYQFGTK